MAKKSKKTKADYAETWEHIDWDFVIDMTAGYIVYVDEDGELNWETTAEYDDGIEKEPKFDLVQCNAIFNEAALLDALSCEGFEPRTQAEVKRLIGEALSRNLQNDYVGANKMLAFASQYWRARSEETSRFWYLSASFGMALPLVMLGLVVLIWRPAFTELFGPTGVWLILAAMAGGIGALLSVILRSGKLQFDSSAGWQLHYLEGASRIWAGMLSGVMIALAVKADVFLTVLNHGNQGAVTMLAALAAGSSERLAGSIISKFESTDAKIGSPTKVKKTKGT
jgi:hypothetical protein